MKYCRKKIIDKRIKEYKISIKYWEYMCTDAVFLTETGYPMWTLTAYQNAIRRLEKLKNG